MCALMSMGVLAYHVHIHELKCVFACVWGSASRPMCTVWVFPLIHWAFTMALWCPFFLHRGEVYQGNPGLPFLPFLSLSRLSFPIHASILPPSAPLFLVSWRGDPDVKGDLDRKRRGRGREREIEIHIPLVTDFIVQDLLGKPLTHTHKQLCSPNNRVPLDDKALLCMRVYAFVCVCVRA